MLLYHELDKEVYLTNIHYLPACRALSVVINDKVLGLFHPDTKTLEEVRELRPQLRSIGNVYVWLMLTYISIPFVAVSCVS